jgi:hypothetical protein
MSSNFKGRQNATLVSEEPVFDAETGVGQFDQTFVGSKAIIFGLARSFEEDRITYRVSNNGPIYSIVARVPNSGVINPDRYEISTESQDKSIFEHPDIIFDAADYDEAVGSGLQYYRDLCERSVHESQEIATSNFSDPATQNARMQTVIRHLKNGATGYQVDFIVLRRFRQVDFLYGNAASGQFNLDTGIFIYSTDQLMLPSAVAFRLPTTPAAPSSDYSWGWKRRGQRVEIVGSLVEQTVELVFAPWSTLLYSTATGNLSW